MQLYFSEDGHLAYTGKPNIVIGKMIAKITVFRDSRLVTHMVYMEEVLMNYVSLIKKKTLPNPDFRGMKLECMKSMND